MGQDLERKLVCFFSHFGRADTAKHSIAVASTAGGLAERFNVDPEQSYAAGLLHDCSCVVTNELRLQYFRERGLLVLPEEEKFPMLIHQQHSAIMAREIFDVDDSEVLVAVACHTTLRAESTPLDKVLFLADKISWDQAGEAPFLPLITAGLSEGLDAGCLAYISWLLGPDGGIRIPHPWLLAALQDLSCVQ